GFRDFLYKQRDTIRLLDDLCEHLDRKRFATGNFFSHPLNLVPRQTIDGDLGQIGSMGPARLEMRSTGHQHKHRSGWGLVEYQVQQLQGRRVRPVEVFDDEQHRLTFSKFQQDHDDGFEGLLSLALWGDVEQRITVFRYRK